MGKAGTVAALTPTPVFDAYWHFAARRQSAYLKRLRGEPAPWTDDPVISVHRFTNVFRAADKVSQYLIDRVIYDGITRTAEDTVFRILLFKLFNRISTWERLELAVGSISWSDYDYDVYASALDAASVEGPIYSAAYIVPPPKFTEARKHQNHLRLLEFMIGSGLTDDVRRARGLKQVFESLVEFPSIGRFLGYQFAIDLNYSELIEFDEDDYVMPGPGAVDGVRKCFGDGALGREPEIIRYVTDSQEEQFARLGLSFDGLFGRRLHLIDCQNVFCEVDKYARVAFPEYVGVTRRTRIKQMFRPSDDATTPVFPPKWGLTARA